MDFEQIKKLIKLAKKENVAQLDYSAGDVKISVKLAMERQVVTTLASPVSVPAVVGGGGKAANAPVVASGEERIHEIRSPFVGTFYRSPSPGEESFAQVGDRVSVGRVLCILEAMKIMNEIESDVAGEIIEICSESESLVEFGQILFKIKKS